MAHMRLLVLLHIGQDEQCTRAPIAGEAAAPQRRINLDDGGTPRRNLPAVKGPEVNPVAQPPADKGQPGNAGMSRFRYRALHVEMKDGLGGASLLFRQPSPARVALAIIVGLGGQCNSDTGRPRACACACTRTRSNGLIKSCRVFSEFRWIRL